ncbi:MAG: hypothetical protein H6R11_2480 [Proteobacteria bacterium]|nr:hypothetical protein [Pseudomonadota bacterium]MBS1213565.1 hypothetical protein [Pseudomonadota bacterium]
MKSVHLTIAFLGTVLAAVPVAALAGGKIDLGKREYEANCALCHGASGKAEGTYAELLKARIPDLTILSKGNNGVFPFARVYETIDGTIELKAHGKREMPIWGQQYRTAAAEYYMDVPYDEQAFVRSRILALTEYIYRLQAK